MAFSANPLALSVPEPEFESWLRDSGYLEILDQRTTDLHRLSSSSSSTTSASAPTDSRNSAVADNFIVPTGFFVSLFSHLWTLLSLLTFNPFAKLCAEDFSGDMTPWSFAFFGTADSYSFPSSPSQARLRVHENIKRFARNYASLFVLFLACSLYQLPLALVGLISCLALWDAFKFCGDRWGLSQYPVLRKTLIQIALCVAAIILFLCNVQLALGWALSVSYAVMILHAAFRKLTTAKQSPQRDGNRKIRKN